MDELINSLKSLQYNAHFRESTKLAVHLIVGGVIGLFLRLLYKRFGLAVANRNSLSSNFPILIITTILVIFVVKSSLALSLGLVGALSIVRFRAAIKEPEELVFLFFCIAVGLAIGAEYAELAVAGVLIFTVFLLIRHRGGRRGAGDTMLLTVSGARQALLDGDATRLMAAVRDAVGAFTLQRLEVQDGQVMFRVVVAPDSPEQLLGVADKLRTTMPGCNVSYVSLSDLI